MVSLVDEGNVLLLDGGELFAVDGANDRGAVETVSLAATRAKAVRAARSTPGARVRRWRPTFAGGPYIPARFDLSEPFYAAGVLDVPSVLTGEANLGDWEISLIARKADGWAVVAAANRELLIDYAGGPVAEWHVLLERSQHAPVRSWSIAFDGNVGVCETMGAFGLRVVRPTLRDLAGLVTAPWLSA